MQRIRLSSVLTALASLGLVLLAACGGEKPSSSDVDSPSSSLVLTYYSDVAPILLEHCVPCHRTDAVAPFTLLTYQDAKAWAARIAEVTAGRTMPPWMPEPGYGRFSGERRLSDDQITLMRRWVEEGAVEGDSADIGPVLAPTAGWQLGEPDLVIELPEAYTLRAGSTDVFRNFVMAIPLDSARYVRTVELRPGNPAVAHHAVMMIDRTGSSRRLEEEDPEPGFDGMLTTRAEAHSPEGFFLGWTPGRVPFAGIDDMAWRLEPGTDFVVQLHLRPTSVTESIAPAVGFHFADRPPTRIAAVIRLGSETMNIPAGVRDYEVKDTYVLPVDVEVLSIYPHAHYLGKEIEAFATLPGGAAEWLIRIRDWNFNWQDEYRYAQPVFLPRGSTVTARIVYDNSPDNPRNPHDPPRRVVYGPNSSDEMGDVWFQLVLADSADLAILIADYAYKDLQTKMAGYEQTLRLNPDSAELHNALGTALQALGRLDEAIAQYRRALGLEADFAVAHYNLAVALRSHGRADEAMEHFRRAVGLEPEFDHAHFELAIILAERDRLGEAIGHLRQALRANPEFAEAHNSLGHALELKGQVGEALEHFRAASSLKPEWLSPMLELAWILATHPDDRIREPDEAVRLAERAAELTRDSDPVVLDVLAAGYGAAGRFDRAVETARAALVLASVAGEAEFAAHIRQRLELYQQSQPYRQPAAR